MRLARFLLLAAMAARPASVLGLVDRPPCIRHRAFPGLLEGRETGTLRHGLPARVFAPQSWSSGIQRQASRSAAKSIVHCVMRPPSVRCNGRDAKEAKYAKKGHAAPRCVCRLGRSGLLAMLRF